MASQLLLIVYDKAAEAMKTGKGSLHDPALGERHKAALGG